ncbi:MAG: tetratricopeptide repeat protein [Terracidiphilus sp.]
MKSLTTPLMHSMGGLAFAALLCATPTASATACPVRPELETQLQSHPTVGGYLRLAHWFDENHQADCATQAFKSALKLDPGSKAALDGLAKELIASGDYQAVIRLLRAAPLDQNLTLDLALAYRKAQSFDESARVLSQGLKTWPNSDNLTAALVSLHVHQYHFAEAQTLAKSFALHKPADLEAQRIYLRTLVITGELDVAAPLGRKLLALAPRDADLLNLNGFIERKSGDYPAARKHLEESVALNPNDFNSRVNLGLVLAQLKDAVGAKEQLEKAIALGATEPQIHFELSKVLRAQGETEEADQQLKLFQQGLKAEADQSQAVLKATQAADAQKNGDKQKAADLYREACTAEPNDAGLAYRLSVALGDLGDLPGQRTALEQTIRNDPNFVLAHYDLGYMDFRGGNNAGAEEQFRLVVKGAPDNARAWVALAAVLATESQLPDARQAVDHALKLDPKNAAALDLNKKLATARQRQPN